MDFVGILMDFDGARMVTRGAPTKYLQAPTTFGLMEFDGGAGTSIKLHQRCPSNSIKNRGVYGQAFTGVRIPNQGSTKH